MIFNKKRSFFERLTGGIKMDSMDEEFDLEESKQPAPRHRSGSVALKPKRESASEQESWMEAEEEEGQLTVDVYQTPGEIVIQTMVAGVRPEDLAIQISRDMITIKGKREESRSISADNYFTKELYWGSFSRTILLPQEIEPEEADAIEKHGLLTIRLPKIDKDRRTQLKIKSL